jgi:signal transduction histidine kinase
MSRKREAKRAARDPLQVNLRRAVWLILLAVIIPTTVLTGIGIAILATQTGSLDVVLGALAVVFAVSVIAGSGLLMFLTGRGVRIAKIQETFLSRMGHELRTPLAGIRLHAQLLEQSALSPDASRSVAAIRQEVDRLTALVERILRWRQVRSRTHLYRKERINGQDVVEHLRRSLGEARQVIWDVREPLPSCQGDVEALSEAVGNLVSNAGKYGGEGGVALQVRQLANRLVFAVSDRGPGLPAGDRDLLFEPFFRHVPADLRDPGGSGLGLSVARQIVQAHGGRIGSFQRPGGGSRFIITLPIEVTR